jgi:hypothetical protein
MSTFSWEECREHLRKIIQEISPNPIQEIDLIKKFQRGRTLIRKPIEQKFLEKRPIRKRIKILPRIKNVKSV